MLNRVNFWRLAQTLSQNKLRTFLTDVRKKGCCRVAVHHGMDNSEVQNCALNLVVWRGRRIYCLYHGFLSRAYFFLTGCVKLPSMEIGSQRVCFTQSFTKKYTFHSKLRYLLYILRPRQTVRLSAMTQWFIPSVPWWTATAHFLRPSVKKVRNVFFWRLDVCLSRWRGSILGQCSSDGMGVARIGCGTDRQTHSVPMRMTSSDRGKLAITLQSLIVIKTEDYENKRARASTCKRYTREIPPKSLHKL